MRTKMQPKMVVFDLGGVLIDWNPRYLYRKIFSREEDMEYFLREIASPDWNEEQDGGRPLAVATKLLIEQFPDFEQEIQAFYGRWDEMLGGYFHETVSLLHDLKQSGRYPLYALTNWSAETWPVAWDRFEFLQWFDGILVSGAEKMRKPFPAFYQALEDRFQCTLPDTLFIDDNERNIQAAQALGMQTWHFRSPADCQQLRAWLL